MNGNMEFHRFFVFMARKKMISIDEMAVIALIAVRIQSMLKDIMKEEQSLDGLFDENKDMPVVIDLNMMNGHGSRFDKRRFLQATETLMAKEQPLAKDSPDKAKIIKEVEHLWPENQLRLTIGNAFLPYLAGAANFKKLVQAGYCTMVTENSKNDTP